MIVPLGTPTVLIVDEDVGFVWWLGEIFHELGCRVIPALNCQEALSFASAVNLAVDLIVASQALPGVLRMTRTLQRARSAKVVAIEPSGNSHHVDLHAHAVLRRPAIGDNVSRVEWIPTVRRILALVGTRAAS